MYPEIDSKTFSTICSNIAAGRMILDKKLFPPYRILGCTWINSLFRETHFF